MIITYFIPFLIQKVLHAYMLLFSQQFFFLYF
jgi:hypothetical protein